MSNSPHPSSSIRKGGFLKAVAAQQSQRQSMRGEGKEAGHTLNCAVAETGM